MDIKELQKLLRQVGQRHDRPDFNPGPADGLFGVRTRNAITAFQYAVGLPVTGVANTATLKALSEALRAEKGQVYLKKHKAQTGSYLPAQSPIIPGMNWTVIGIVFAIGVSLLTMFSDGSKS